jgi:3-oxoacid CoA-transferase subunit A
MYKTYSNSDEALSGILHDNMTIMIGGFGAAGVPENLINVILKSNIQNITAIMGTNNFGLNLLLQSNQVKKIIASYVGEDDLLKQQYLDKTIHVELVPQGTLAERIRAGGSGIAAFYTKTGVGTIVQEGKELREFDGKKYLMETALTADLAIIKGFKGDESGNITYNKTARNFNQMMATAGKITVCEVEELVKTGQLNPESIHTPNIYVDRLVKGEKYNKYIEHLVYSE